MSRGGVGESNRQAGGFGIRLAGVKAARRKRRRGSEAGGISKSDDRGRAELRMPGERRGGAMRGQERGAESVSSSSVDEKPVDSVVGRLRWAT